MLFLSNAAASPEQLNNLAKLIKFTDQGILGLKRESKRLDHAQHQISQNCAALQFLIDNNHQDKSCIIAQEWVKQIQLLIEKLLINIIKNDAEIERLNDQIQQEENKLQTLRMRERVLSGSDISNEAMLQSAFGKSATERMRLR